VSLLYAFEDCKDLSDWEIGIHGLIIDFLDLDGNKRNGTYLPEVAPEQEWTKSETVKSLIRKTGYEGTISDKLLTTIKATRYKSSQSKLHYKEYQAFKQQRVAQKDK